MSLRIQHGRDLQRLKAELECGKRERLLAVEEADTRAQAEKRAAVKAEKVGSPLFRGNLAEGQITNVARF